MISGIKPGLRGDLTNLTDTRPPHGGLALVPNWRRKHEVHQRRDALMTQEIIIQAIISGLLMGFVYALISVGL